MNKEKIDKMIEILEAIKGGVEFEARVFDTPELWEKIIPDTANLLFRTVNGQFSFVEQVRIIPQEEAQG